MGNEVLEKEKYYTPSIEEFHVGFEYEYSDNIEYSNWIKHTINNLPDYIDCVEDIKYELIRVKYLDREDIESFGFESIVTKSIGKKHYTMSGEKSTRGNLLLEHDWLNDKITIKTPNYIRDASGRFDGYIVYVYRLIIKNKSEFSRLLKQLSII